MLTLELGKFYENGNGCVVEITILRQYKTMFPFVDSDGNSYNKHGICQSDSFSYDLHREVNVPPVQEPTHILKSNLLAALTLASAASRYGSAFQVGLKQVIADLQSGKTLVVKED